MKTNLLDRVVIDPKICFGKPTIKGTRIWVSLILDSLASGLTIDAILEEYPELTETDVRACISYGAMITNMGFSEIDLKYANEI